MRDLSVKHCWKVNSFCGGFCFLILSMHIQVLFVFFKKRELFVVVVVEMLQTFPSLHSEKEDSLSCSNTFLCSPDIQPGPVSYTGVQTATVRVSIYILFCCCQLFVVFLICRFYLTFGIAGQEMCLLIRLQITWYFLKTV